MKYSLPYGVTCAGGKTSLRAPPPSSYAPGDQLHLLQISQYTEIDKSYSSPVHILTHETYSLWYTRLGSERWTLEIATTSNNSTRYCSLPLNKLFFQLRPLLLVLSMWTSFMTKTKHYGKLQGVKEEEPATHP